MEGQARLIRRPEISGGGATPPELSVAQLAHELNSLLDGSMRSLGLARRSLASAGPSAGSAPVLRNLGAAHEAMRSMAGLLQRAMLSSTLDLHVLRSGRTMRESLPAVIALVQPLADACGATLDWHLDAGAAELPAGLLEPVILNGLRNAVQAVATMPEGARSVRLSVAAVPHGRVELTIEDSGPGPNRTAVRDDAAPAGHGLGLALCRTIAARLGGSLRLEARAHEPGAVLHVAVSAERLAGPEVP
jgi:two-component system heavy metal sensor histidine kinase CusS